MNKDNTHNGWTNYATWRVNLEMVDGYELSEEQALLEAYELGQQIQEDMESYIEDELRGSSLGLSYALAFMADVNWTEIAENLLSEYKLNKES